MKYLTILTLLLCLSCIGRNRNHWPMDYEDPSFTQEIEDMDSETFALYFKHLLVEDHMDLAEMVFNEYDLVFFEEEQLYVDNAYIDKFLYWIILWKNQGETSNDDISTTAISLLLENGANPQAVFQTPHDIDIPYEGPLTIFDMAIAKDLPMPLRLMKEKYPSLQCSTYHIFAIGETRVSYEVLDILNGQDDSLISDNKFVDYSLENNIGLIPYLILRGAYSYFPIEELPPMEFDGSVDSWLSVFLYNADRLQHREDGDDEIINTIRDFSEKESLDEIFNRLICITDPRFYIYENEINPYDPYRETLDRWELFKWFLDAGASPGLPVTITIHPVYLVEETSPFQLAISENNEDLIQYMVGLEFQAQAQDLLACISTDRIDLFTELLRNGGEINEYFTDKEMHEDGGYHIEHTLLTYAIRNNRYDYVELLLENGADFNLPLKRLIGNSDFDYQFSREMELDEYGFKVNPFNQGTEYWSNDISEINPLAIALLQGNSEIETLLRQYGAEVLILNRTIDLSGDSDYRPIREDKIILESGTPVLLSVEYHPDTDEEYTQTFMLEEYSFLED